MDSCEVDQTKREEGNHEKSYLILLFPLSELNKAQFDYINAVLTNGGKESG